MKKDQRPEKIELIPIDRITIINPRVRNHKSFKDIVENIDTIGLKKPITVARRDDPDGPRYDLVCGQGRLEAYQSLGEAMIPAIVREADTEECLLQSLVENCARRRHDAKYGRRRTANTVEGGHSHGDCGHLKMAA